MRNQLKEPSDYYNPIKETDSCNTTRATTLRDRLQEIIKHCKETRIRIDNEEIQAEKALTLLNKNKELETLVDLLNR